MIRFQYGYILNKLNNVYALYGQEVWKQLSHNPPKGLHRQANQCRVARCSKRFRIPHKETDHQAHRRDDRRSKEILKMSQSNLGITGNGPVELKATPRVELCTGKTMKDSTTPLGATHNTKMTQYLYTQIYMLDCQGIAQCVLHTPQICKAQAPWQVLNGQWSRKGWKR